MYKRRLANASGNRIIGIDLGATNVKMALVDERGNIYCKKVFSTKSYRTKNQLIDRLISDINKLITHNPSLITHNLLKGIGIGAPGLIDSDRGMVHCFVNIPNWQDVRLCKIIKDRTDVAQVFIDNDVNVMALGELYFGAGCGAKNILCITLGSGVGGGLIIDGHIYRGASLSAGEIGHTTINEDGPKCKCGNKGCTETYVGNSYIVEEAIRKVKRPAIAGTPKSKVESLVKGDLNKITPEIICKAAELGDKLALGIWQSVAEHLGTALANAVNLLNPEMIIIGGGVSNAWRFLYPHIRRTIYKRAHRICAQTVKIVRAELGEDAGIIGASVLVREKLEKSFTTESTEPQRK